MHSSWNFFSKLRLGLHTKVSKDLLYSLFFFFVGWGGGM